MFNAKTRRPLCIVATLFSIAGINLTHAMAEVVNFDDLISPPALTSAISLKDANGGSSVIQGVDWGNGFNLVGDEYRVDTATPGPLFGIPHSGHYFITNRDGADGLIVTTSRTLLGAWFGRNEYYGFGAGADQVTITALGSGGDLLSYTLDLPITNAGDPEPLTFLDTSGFLGISGIEGYRIDRRELGSQSGHWVGDDFVFSVPEPSSWILVAFGTAFFCVGYRKFGTARSVTGTSVK